VPTGVAVDPAPAELTVAVRVTVWPRKAGLGAAVRDVVVAVPVTVSVAAPELATKLTSPE
jgi:hypothetical protein